MRFTHKICNANFKCDYIKNKKQSSNNKHKAEEVQKLIGEKLYAYIQENNLDVLGEPIAHDDQVDIEKDDNFVLHFDLGLSPEMNIELSANDTVDYYDINVTAEMVDAQVKRMAQQAGVPAPLSAAYYEGLKQRAAAFG